jgi:ATP synthase protein I
LTDKDNFNHDRDPERDRRRVDDLQARLRAARENEEKRRPKRALESGMSHRQTGVAYRVLVDMIAGLLAGGLVGYWLDRWLGWTPYSLVVGLILGFTGGVNNAWRAIRAYSEEANKEGSDKGSGDRSP